MGMNPLQDLSGTSVPTYQILEVYMISKMKKILFALHHQYRFFNFIIENLYWIFLNLVLQEIIKFTWTSLGSSSILTISFR